MALRGRCGVALTTSLSCHEEIRSYLCYWQIESPCVYRAFTFFGIGLHFEFQFTTLL